jgi:hypothetical protein
MVFCPEEIRSSMMSRAECARKWYFRLGGHGGGREFAGLRVGSAGVEGGLGNVRRYKGLFWC